MATPPRPSPEAIVNHNIRIPAHLDEKIRKEAETRIVSITSIFIDALANRYAIPDNVYELIRQEHIDDNRSLTEIIIGLIVEKYSKPKSENEQQKEETKE